MASPIKTTVKKEEATQINYKVPVEIFRIFQKKCKKQNYTMKAVFETFFRQYKNGNYQLNHQDIVKWKKYKGENSTCSTQVNKAAYEEFFRSIKEKGYFARHIIIAFIEEYGKSELCFGIVRNTESMNDDYIHPTIEGAGTNTDIAKGNFRCPNCRMMFQASTAEAVLLKYPNDDTLYLYCKECGEKEKARFGGADNE